MERRLGRGLGSLLGEGAAAAAQGAGAQAPFRPGDSPAAPAPAVVGGPLELALDQIQPNPFQPRKNFDQASLEDLANSMRRHGLLQPIVVRRCGAGHQIVSGERRWRAARIAGLRSIPVIVREGVNDRSMLELALIENVQREDLGAIEKALGYREMIQRLNLTQEQVAESVGLKRATITNHLRLLDLPEKAQEALTRALISMGHARALLGLEDERKILQLVERCVRQGLSVRQVEQLVRDQRPGGGEPSGARAEGPGKTLVPRAPWMIDLESRMRETLGTKAVLKNEAGYRGQIVIDYYSRDDLERLAALLAPRPTI